MFIFDHPKQHLSQRRSSKQPNMMSPTSSILIIVVACLCSVTKGAAPPTHSPHHHSSSESDGHSLHGHYDKMVMDQPHDMTHHHRDHDMKDGMDEGMDMGNMTDHGMNMFFHFSVNEYVLFQGWKVTTAGGMAASMIGVFLMGMLYEGLKYFREYLFKQYVSKIQFSTVAMTGESGRVTQVHKVERHKMLSWPHALQTALHVVQIILSYFLMLIFMTYNVWLCFAVVLGAGVGYFIFGWRKASVVDITEHCH